MVLIFLILLVLIVILFYFILKEDKNVVYQVIRFNKCKSYKFKSNSTPNFVSILNCNDELVSFTVEGEKIIDVKDILSVSENIQVFEIGNGIKMFTIR
jgi:hypothetical protein